MESQKTSVLLLLPTKHQKETMLRHIRSGGSKYERYDVTMIGDDEISSFNLCALYEKVAAMIRTSPILPLVVPTHDNGAIVQAALALEFPHIKAPSVLSEFIALHKGETYKLTPSDYMLPTLQLKADAGDYVSRQDLTEAGLVNFPLFIKPSMGTNSALVKKVDSFEKLREFLVQGKPLIPEVSAGIKDFVSKFVTHNSIQRTIEDVWILQPFVDYKDNGRLCGVDGLVHNGKMSFWNIHEFVFWDKAPTVFKCYASPPELEDGPRRNLLEAHRYIVSELIAHGFNNQFASLEAFVVNTGKIYVAEVNARALRINWKGYMGVNKENGDGLMALLSVAEGDAPQEPTGDPNVHACIGYVSVFGEGKAKDFIDLDQARKVEAFDLRCDENTDVSSNGEWGCQLAYCTTFGQSRVEATEKARVLIDRVMMAKDLCYWLSD